MFQPKNSKVRDSSTLKILSQIIKCVKPIEIKFGLRNLEAFTQNGKHFLNAVSGIQILSAVVTIKQKKKN